MITDGVSQIAVNLLQRCDWDSNLLQSMLGGGLSGGFGAAIGWVAKQAKYSLNKVLAVAGDLDDPVIRLARNTIPKPGVYDIISHGKPDGLQLFSGRDTKWASAKEVASWLLTRPDYTPGMPVRLVACNTARGGEASFAQQFAREINAEVTGATAFVKPEIDGSLSLVAKPVWSEELDEYIYESAGEWITLHP
jgi:hypothetical protein